LQVQPQAWREPIAAGRPNRFLSHCGATVIPRFENVGQAIMALPDLARQLGDGEPVQPVEMFRTALRPWSGGRIESVMHVGASFEDSALHWSAQAAILVWFRQPFQLPARPARCLPH
jgi:hypothetical protein